MNLYSVCSGHRALSSVYFRTGFDPFFERPEASDTVKTQCELGSQMVTLSRARTVSKDFVWCSVAETGVPQSPLTSSAPPSYARVCRSECRGEMPSKQRQRNRRTPFCPASFPSKVRKSLPPFSQVMRRKWSARNGS